MRTRLNGPGMILAGLLLFFFIASGLLFKVIAAVIVIKIVLYIVSPNNSNNAEKQGKDNLPPKLAEKLNRRINVQQVRNNSK